MRLTTRSLGAPLLSSSEIFHLLTVGEDRGDNWNSLDLNYFELPFYIDLGGSLDQTPSLSRELLFSNNRRIVEEELTQGK